MPPHALLNGPPLLYGMIRKGMSEVIFHHTLANSQHASAEKSKELAESDARIGMQGLHHADQYADDDVDQPFANQQGLSAALGP